MTITINGPNGVTVNFPDGTDTDTINTVMSHATGLSAPKTEEARPASKATLGDVGMAALRGIPIAGGLIERYSSPESQEDYKQFDKDHPWLSGLAGAAGGVAALAPIAMGTVATGGVGPALLGMTGATLGRQAINSAVSGAAIGGLDALTRGNDVKENAELGGVLGLAGPLAGRAIGSAVTGAKNMVTPVARVPSNFERVGNVNVPLDRGQATGDVVAQRYIETGKQGNFGSAAQQEVNAFRDLQGQGVENAKQDIRGTLGGAEATPLEAADVVQQGVQQKAAQAKAAYQNKYDEFGNMHGEVHAGVFEGLGQRIKGDLSFASNPVVIDDRVTPAASALIQHVDNGISKARIQNRADPFGQPNPENVTGVSLKGVEQFRKQMLSIAGGAANPTDARASRAIISAFDDRLQNAVNSHLYSGDPNAFGTLQDARKLFSTYAQTFRSQGPGDMAGRVVESMLGKFGQPANHNEIVNWLYGASKIGGNREAGHVADKLRGILGDGTPEWQTIRQGLFSKLVDTTEGKIAEGPQKISQRIAEFLNGTGKQFAEKIYSPEERALIGQYGELMRKMTPLPGAVNHSGSGYQVASMMKWTLNSLATLGGLHVGGPMGALAGVAANSLGKGMIEGTHTRAIARNLYSPTAAPMFPNSNVPATQAAGTLLSRAVVGRNGR